jgi:hypothetical protein
MALLTVQHTVRDYAAWRAVYDTLDEVQRDWGVTAAAVYQLACVPNTVLVLHHFATVAQAQGFLTNREVEDAMRRAGVEGAPRVEIYA